MGNLFKTNKKGGNKPIQPSAEQLEPEEINEQASPSESRDCLQPEPPKVLRMYLDANRDGAIDDVPANYGDWQQGENGGAVIMVNTWNYADGQNVLARMEIQFRWDNDTPEPAVGWQARLTIDHANRVEIFQVRTEGAVAVAPDLGGAINLHQAPFQVVLAAGQLSLWIQAANFPAVAAEASWRVRLTFTYSYPNGQQVQQTAQLRIAPWIMASDLDPVSNVLFVAANPPTDMQHEIQNFLPAEVQPYMRPPPGIAGDKPFLRDVIRCGWIRAPHHQDIVVLERLDLGTFVNLAAGMANVGRISTATAGIPAARSAQDGGGNMLVTPPTDQYPFGRIVYGANPPDYPCHAAGFFAAQGKQAPLVVDSHWLSVGHVDEFIGFVRDATNVNWPYKILLASPRLGYILAYGACARYGTAYLDNLCDIADEVNDASRAANENWPAMLQRCQDEFGNLVHMGGGAAGGTLWGPVPGPGDYDADPAPPVRQNGKVVRWVAGGSYSVRSIDSYLADPGQPTHEWMFDTVQQPFIDAARQTLLAGLVVGGVPLNDNYIIEIPVMLRPNAAGMLIDTADSVNMLILGNNCLVPKPFGPVCGEVSTYLFEYYIRRKLPLGLTVTFLNDWEGFHVHEGEIHCGTNQVPQPLPDDRAWWL